MEVFDRLQKLVNVKFNTFPVQAVRFFFQHLEEIAIHELKHQVKFALPLIWLFYK